MAAALANMINHNMTPPCARSLGNILGYLTGRAEKTQPLMKSTKFKAPNTKEISKIKLQPLPTLLKLGALHLGFNWCLEL